MGIILVESILLSLGGGLIGHAVGTRHDRRWRARTSSSAPAFRLACSNSIGKSWCSSRGSWYWPRWSAFYRRWRRIGPTWPSRWPAAGSRVRWARGVGKMAKLNDWRFADCAKTQPKSEGYRDEFVRLVSIMVESGIGDCQVDLPSVRSLAIAGNFVGVPVLQRGVQNAQRGDEGRRCRRAGEARERSPADERFERSELGHGDVSNRRSAERPGHAREARKKSASCFSAIPIAKRRIWSPAWARTKSIGRRRCR